MEGRKELGRDPLTEGGNDMNEELGLAVVDSKVVVSSRVVAEVFGKEHRDILKAARNLETTEEFNQRNFALVEYRDGKGEMRPEYLLTRDGFTILAMGFTGPKAMRFKEAYINAFNKMEEKLRDRHALNAPQTYPEALRALAEEYEQRAIAEAERDKAVREKAWISEKREATAMGKLGSAMKKIYDLENKLGEGREWKSVRAIDWLLNYFWDTVGSWMAIGHALTKLSRERGYAVMRVDDPLYNKVNAYHVDVIREFKDTLFTVIKPRSCLSAILRLYTEPKLVSMEAPATSQNSALAYVYRIQLSHFTRLNPKRP